MHDAINEMDDCNHINPNSIIVVTIIDTMADADPKLVVKNEFRPSTHPSSIIMSVDRAAAKKFIDALRHLNSVSMLNHIQKSTVCRDLLRLGTKVVVIQPPRMVAKFLLIVDPALKYEYDKGNIVFVFRYRTNLSGIMIDWSVHPRFPYTTRHKDGLFFVGKMTFNFFQMSLSSYYDTPRGRGMKLDTLPGKIFYDDDEYNIEHLSGLYFACIPIADGRIVRVPIDPYNLNAGKVEETILTCKKDDTCELLDYIQKHQSPLSIFDGVYLDDVPLTFSS